MNGGISTLKLERRSLWGAGVLGVASIGLAILAPSSLAVACRLAIFACLAPSIGCTVFTLIHRITGGQWTSGLAPFLRSGMAMLPWTWTFAAPVLLLSRRHYSTGLGYDGLAMVAVRAALFAVLFFALRWALSDGVGDEGDARRNVRPWAGPVGLIVLFFTLTFLADDWLESLEENWHSTAFAVVWIAGQALCGLALCVLGGLATGRHPSSKGSAERALGLDWGNLLLAAVMFWAYVSFAQFLIIWAGNLPEETSWYLRRQHGSWRYVIPGIALLGFAGPFFILLSRRLKQSSSGVAFVASMLVTAQLAYTAWLIIPAHAALPKAGATLAAALAAAALLFFANRFMRTARLLGRPA